ncbi:MAG: hypothetical protein MK033_09520 [Candidatus Caenarcaniphilales bacterium]|nr:hypothetical protein [Candidatus Caenarcaniphilales bacterium]
MGETTHYGLRNYLSAVACTSVTESNQNATIYRVDLESSSQYHQHKYWYLYLIFYSDDIVRFYYSLEQSITKFQENQFIDWGYLDKQELKIAFLEDVESYQFITRKIKLIINKDSLASKIYNIDGELISADLSEAGFCFQENEIRSYKSYEDLESPPLIYGLGDKSGEINRWGRDFINKPLDALGYDASNSDPLYKDIPFFIVLDRKHNKSHGIFFDNLSEKFFNFGRERKPIPYYYFGAKAGEMNYYFIYGPSVKEVSQKYISLSSKPPLMPEFSFAYLASGMAYTERDGSADEINSFIERHEEQDIHPKGFHLSSGYTLNDKNQRLQFTWNNEKFPEVSNFTAKLSSKGVELCTNLKPVLLLEHPLYQEAKALDLFINDKPGTPLIVDYWSGQGSYIDFSKAQSQKWWKEKIKESFIDKGIRGIWNDNNEYEIFTEHEQENQTIIQSSIMSQISWEASLESRKDLRPWILSRCGYAGIQKYVQTWTGDNYSSFKSLKYDNAIISSMGLSGLIHSGCDIGGFWGSEASPKLLLRWIQSGVFNPRFCIHSYKDIPTEILQLQDSVDEAKPNNKWSIAKRYMHLRDKLLPYIYQANYKAATEAVPMQRPLVYDFQNDSNCHEQSFQFMFGDSLMVVPLFDNSSERVYLPRHDNRSWIDFFSLLEYENGQSITFNAEKDDIPVLVKANSVIAMLEDEQSLKLRIYVNSDELSKQKELGIKYKFYEDDGNTNMYLDGEYLLRELLIRVKLDTNNEPKTELNELMREGKAKSRYIINTESVFNGKLYN